jgi:hypothetical protein
LSVLSGPTPGYNRSPNNLLECEESLARLKVSLEEEKIRFKLAEAKYAVRLKGIRAMREQLKSLESNLKMLKTTPIVSMQEFINIKAAIYKVTETLGGLTDDAKEVEYVYVTSKSIVERYQKDQINIETLKATFENNVEPFPYDPRRNPEQT